jgi:protein-S-isoprenylcysteine O-methyltransferase Ste14
VILLSAIVFTIALAFATVELPRILNGVLVRSFVDIPAETLRGGHEPQSIDAFMNVARIAGYFSLLVVAVLVVIGFISGRKKLTLLGSFAFFIPAFGYFAATMFLLAGIGIFRIMWLPLWDISPALLELGDIAYLPYWIVTYPFSALLGPIAGNSVGIFLAYLAIAMGLMIFCLGAFTWLSGKAEGKKLFDFWIYRYSRHPQYLGFIVWSYGVILLANLEPNQFWARQPQATLPWLISTLLVICVGFMEEISMTERTNANYASYRRRTPFMLPLPSALSALLLIPNRTVMKKAMPENKMEVVCVFLLYCAILMFLSALIIPLEGPLLELRS